MSENKIDALICTSVSDAKITLENQLARDPQKAKELALELLEALKDREGHQTRISIANATVRKAERLLKKA